MYLTFFASWGPIAYLRSFRTEVVDASNGIFQTAAVLAGILALFVTVKNTADILSGKPNTLWNVVRPFVIMLVIATFNISVMGPINVVTDYVTDGINSLTVEPQTRAWTNIVKIFQVTEKSRNSIKSNIDNVTAVADSTGTGIQPEDKTVSETGSKGFVSSIWEAGFDYIKRVFAGILGMAVHGIMVIALTALFIIYNLSYLLFGMLSQLICCVIAILGPFTLAFSVWLGFGHFQKWITTYIQIAIWPAVASIINYVTQTIIVTMTDDITNGKLNSFEGVSGLSGLLGKGADTYASVTSTFFILTADLMFVGLTLICALVLLYQTPKFASLIIDGVGEGFKPSVRGVTDRGRAVNTIGGALQSMASMGK